MKKILALLTAMAAIFFFILLSPLRALEVPKSDGFVTDLADVLTTEQEQYLEKTLREYGKSKKQIAILIINSLEGENIDAFGTKVAHTWGVGQRDKDSGVLLTISKSDQKLRIDVGYGLEGALPDGLCGSIIRRVIVPEFKAKNYYAGITKGVEKIQQAIVGEYTENIVAAEEQAEAAEAAETMRMIGYIISLFLLFIAAWIVSSFIRPIVGGVCGAITVSILTVWFYNFGWWVLLSFALGAVVGYFSSDIGCFLKEIAEVMTESGGSGSSGSRSSGSGGGGFGGGSFGGGGASGSW